VNSLFSLQLCFTLSLHADVKYPPELPYKPKNRAKFFLGNCCIEQQGSSYMWSLMAFPINMPWTHNFLLNSDDKWLLQCCSVSSLGQLYLLFLVLCLLLWNFITVFIISKCHEFLLQISKRERKNCLMFEFIQCMLMNF